MPSPATPDAIFTERKVPQSFLAISPGFPDRSLKENLRPKGGPRIPSIFTRSDRLGLNAQTGAESGEQGSVV
jgi:hypothetical protein